MPTRAPAQELVQPPLRQSLLQQTLHASLCTIPQWPMSQVCCLRWALAMCHMSHWLQLAVARAHAAESYRRENAKIGSHHTYQADLHVLLADT